MRKFKFKFGLTIVSLFSMLLLTLTASGGPIRFNNVVQVIDAAPDRAATGTSTRLRLANGDVVFTNGDSDNDNDKDKKKGDDQTNGETAQNDDRVIRETSVEIVRDEDCNCAQPLVATGGFPKWALLGLGAVPLLFLIPRDKEREPTPTPPSGGMTPTPTMTPTPPAPVPEPMTLILFGTGLAGIGAAARRKFGRREEDE